MQEWILRPVSTLKFKHSVVREYQDNVNSCMPHSVPAGISTMKNVFLLFHTWKVVKPVLQNEIGPRGVVQTIQLQGMSHSQGFRV